MSADAPTSPATPSPPEASPAVAIADPTEDGRYCGARTRQSASHPHCRNRAGMRTGHLGNGRCWLHGGRNPIKHGRYSIIKREELRGLIAHFEQDPEPLNMLAELAAARALFTDFVNRYETFAAALIAWYGTLRPGTDGEATPEPAPRPRQVLDIADAQRLLAEVTRTVERIERIRAQNAISRPDFVRVMTEMGRVVQAHVTDEQLQQKIREGWLAIRL